MDCSPPGSSAYGILQARILEWVPFPSPGDLPDPGTEPMSPALAGEFFTTEPPGYYMSTLQLYLNKKTFPTLCSEHRLPIVSY